MSLYLLDEVPSYCTEFNLRAEFKSCFANLVIIFLGIELKTQRTDKQISLKKTGFENIAPLSLEN